MPRPESSIWGNILTCIEIGLHIYAMQAERNSGLVLDADYAKEALSEDALKLGNKHGDHVYFDDVKSIVPTFELLKQDAITDPEIQEQWESPEKLAEHGKFFAPDYFGEFAPPQDTPWTTTTHTQPLYNGIYFIEQDDEWKLAVHQTIGEHCLSEMAVQVSSGQGEYLLYPLNHCAIPIYELSASHPTVMGQIINEDSLLHTLCEDYPVYVAMHNLYTEDWGHIYDQPAPKSLFLQLQMDQVTNQEPQAQNATDAYTHQGFASSLQAREPQEDFFEPSEDLEW
ncbi:hypothetical protein SAMN04487895_11738 [Paenibacillus sophorae]|uniref:Uncharacterized protein n=1 Tax=Paenibacillus sophorae TaxID=1333845 RepID=A0A1H8UDG8_9BACL|nr:hypothetical protein [Paenibacillus sophorae]QWU13180.1 hypothetical protein KP014_14240 [Paenibacillus sophorae]SEP01077.1 hypothetical protein SAMN04487895_11738 [Paenibacillus sophorae]